MAKGRDVSSFNEPLLNPCYDHSCESGFVNLHWAINIKVKHGFACWFIVEGGNIVPPALFTIWQPFQLSTVAMNYHFMSISHISGKKISVLDEDKGLSSIPRGQIKLIRLPTLRALEATLDLKSDQQHLARATLVVPQTERGRRAHTQRHALK